MPFVNLMERHQKLFTNFLIPHMGKIPKVMPRAAEKAACLGSKPLPCMDRKGLIPWLIIIIIY
jgi:hypothetical protein